MRNVLTISIIFMMLMKTSEAQLKLTFPSKDGVTITADWYPENSEYPIDSLCLSKSASVARRVQGDSGAAE